VKVLISDALAPAAAEVLRGAGHEVIVRTGLGRDELLHTLQGCQALLVRGATKVTAEVLRGAPDLRVVARAGTGLDNVDVAVAKERGVLVLNTPAANAVSVAELTIGLMLALERHLVDAVTDLRQGRWEKTRYLGRELMGRTLGLVGFGRIGRDVAVRARAFGMTVMGYDPVLPAWPAEFSWARRAESLDALLAESDVVSLHVPLVPETRNLIGAAQLARMKPDALLVNCARGGTVDEPALHAALTSGRLRGAALDVFASEPNTDSPLIGLRNVVATPHLGASTSEAQDRAGVEAAELVVSALERLTVS
jgi:D-3-phosphoglycerate dehydrogenase